MNNANGKGQLNTQQCEDTRMEFIDWLPFEPKGPMSLYEILEVGLNNVLPSVLFGLRRECPEFFDDIEMDRHDKHQTHPNARTLPLTATLEPDAAIRLVRRIRRYLEDETLATRQHNSSYRKPANYYKLIL